jgi:hypothetical protein
LPRKLLERNEATNGTIALYPVVYLIRGIHVIRGLQISRALVVGSKPDFRFMREKHILADATKKEAPDRCHNWKAKL